MKKVVAPVKEYKLTSEQLASYQNEETTTKQYNAPTYAVLDNETIYAIGKAVGRNCMKKQYQLRGLEDYNPNNPSNWATLEDFQGNAILAIYEYCKVNNFIGMELSEDTFDEDKFDNEDMHQLRLVGYKACNQEGRAIRQNVYKHLYIEAYTDEDNNPMYDIVDVTAQIQVEEAVGNNEVIKELWQHFKPTQKTVIKYVSQGYTDETISKRLGCTRRNVCKIRHTYKRKALEVVKASPTLAEQLKDYTK